MFILIYLYNLALFRFLFIDGSLFFQKMFQYDHLVDINKLYTNNIVTIANTYGIEAAQRSIIREIKAVQSAYDIKVIFLCLSNYDV